MSLYVGVDVGLTSGNDHGPASKKTPYLYDILSLKPNGKGLKVFASGIRQPWQFDGEHRQPVVEVGAEAASAPSADCTCSSNAGAVECASA